MKPVLKPRKLWVTVTVNLEIHDNGQVVEDCGEKMCFMNLVTHRSKIRDTSMAVWYFCLPTLYFVRMQERRYREAILRDVSQVNTPTRSRTKPPHRIQHKPSTSGRRHPEIRRPPSSQFFCHNSFLKVFRTGIRHIPVYLLLFMSLFPVKVNENELLPLLLEELPHLHISSHVQGRMWQQQKQQVDRLHSVASPSRRHHSKLTSQVGPWRWRIPQEQQHLCVWHFCLLLLRQLEEAQRKHDLLVEILHKDQEHKRRLVSTSSPSTCSASWVHRHMRMRSLW